MSFEEPFVSLPPVVVPDLYCLSDLFYVHYWDWTTSTKELMDSLHVLIEQGKVLYLGASDTSAWIVATANTYAVDHGKTPLASTGDAGTC